MISHLYLSKDQRKGIHAKAVTMVHIDELKLSGSWNAMYFIFHCVYSVFQIFLRCIRMSGFYHAIAHWARCPPQPLTHGHNQQQCHCHHTSVVLLVNFCKLTIDNKILSFTIVNFYQDNEGK